MGAIAMNGFKRPTSPACEASMRRFAGFVLVSTIAGVFSLPAIAADLPS